MVDLVRFERREHETHTTLQGRRCLVHLLSCDDNISRLACAVRAQNAPGKIRGSPSEGVRNVRGERGSKRLSVANRNTTSHTDRLKKVKIQVNG
jgi:hypothetical protein